MYSGREGAGWQNTSGQALVPVPTELPEAWSVGGDSWDQVASLLGVSLVFPNSHGGS